MNPTNLHATVQRIVHETPVTDIHTHLYPPAFGDLLLWGIDELLTYHYLIAEVMRVTDVTYDAYWAMPKQQQADLVWRELFLERSPLSEACRGVLTVLHALGLDTGTRDLNVYRDFFREQRVDDFVDTVFTTARLESVVMTNDPFDDTERAVWLSGHERDPRFHAALRIDPLLSDWAKTCPRLHGWGYGVEPELGGNTFAEVRRFLDEWIERMDARYMAVSLPPDWTFPEPAPRGRIIEEAVLPAARDRGIPFALMVGVTRQVNPRLRLAGDGVAKADVSALSRLCAKYPENRFLTTFLARENQHELCVAARKFPNLLVFGCWWFLNNPSLIEEITRMRLELLGLSVIPQHSDARVLDQVIYKWAHSREILARVLADKYADLARTGWIASEDEIRRDVRRLLGGTLSEFTRTPPPSPAATS